MPDLAFSFADSLNEFASVFKSASVSGSGTDSRGERPPRWRRIDPDQDSLPG